MSSRLNNSSSPVQLSKSRHPGAVLKNDEDAQKPGKTTDRRSESPRRFKIVQMSNSSSQSNLKQEISLPKTVTTKKGALLLKTGENASPTLKSNEMPIKTVNDLQRNVLFYGVDKTNFPIEPKKAVETTNNAEKNVSNAPKDYYGSSFLDHSGYLTLMNYSTKVLFNSTSNEASTEHKPQTNGTEGGEEGLKKINRGFSARRYVNNLTKNWDQDVLDKFISNGKINKNTIYDKPERDTKRKRVDDLTAMPQVYRLDRACLSELNNHRIYKFIKTQEQTKEEPSHEPKTKFKQKFIELETIKVVDKQSTELNYKILNPAEKRKVLSELLFYSAINNIMNNQIKEPEDFKVDYQIEIGNSDKLHVKNYPEDLGDIPKSEQHLLEHYDDRSPPNRAKSEYKDPTESMRYKSKSEIKLRKETVDPNLSSKSQESTYMFGKSLGAPWINKKIMNQKTEKTKEQIRQKSPEQNLAKKSVSNMTNPANSFIEHEPRLHRQATTLKPIKKKETKSVESSRPFERETMTIRMKREEAAEKPSSLGRNPQASTIVVPKTSDQVAQKTPNNTDRDKSSAFVEMPDVKEIIAPLQDVTNKWASKSLSVMKEKQDSTQTNYDKSGVFDIKTEDMDYDETEDYYQMPPVIRESTNASLIKQIESPITKSQIKLSEKMPLISNSIVEEKKRESTQNTPELTTKSVSKIGTLDYKTKSHSTSSLNETSYNKPSHQAPIKLPGLNQKTEAQKQIATGPISNQSKTLPNSKPYVDAKKKIDLNYNEKEEKLLIKFPQQENNKIKTQTELKADPLKLNDAITSLNAPAEPKASSRLQRSKSFNRGPIGSDYYTINPMNQQQQKNAKYRSFRVSKKDVENSLETKDKADYSLTDRSEHVAKDETSSDYQVLHKPIESSEKVKFKDVEKPVENSDSADEEYQEVEKRIYYTDNNLPTSNLHMKPVIKDHFIRGTDAHERLSIRFFKDSSGSGISHLSTKAYQSVRIKKTTNKDSEESNLSNALIERLCRRKTNWESGLFDPRDCIAQWSYETPVPPVKPKVKPVYVDKLFAESLKKYAELIAKNVLGRKCAGMSLSEDAKNALQENLNELKESIYHDELEREVIEEYKKVFKIVFAKVLHKKKLERIDIDDDLLIKLTELPHNAFELYVDDSGAEKLRIKESYQNEYLKMIRTVVTQYEIKISDFTARTNPLTGEREWRLQIHVAKILGIPEDKEVFEIYTDEFNRYRIRLKNNVRSVIVENTTYRLIYENDKTFVKMMTKQRIGHESMEEILRLAALMSPESRHYYLLELLKVSGPKMAEKKRRLLLDEIMKNAKYLPESMKENFLTDLLNELVAELPKELGERFLADLMKSSELLDPRLKERVMNKFLESLDSLPKELKKKALAELIKNLDNLPFEKRQQFLEKILGMVENMNDDYSDDAEGLKAMKNQIYKEIIKNSANFDEDTRNKILKDVLDKVAELNNNELPQTILEELVKQIDSLPSNLKNVVDSEIRKHLEKGTLDGNVLNAILSKASDFSPDLLKEIVKNSDKMDAYTLKELVKNLDKLPDDLKSEVLKKMLDNLDGLDTVVQQQLLKELMKNPNLIEDEALRAKVMGQILNKLSAEDIMREVENMSAEEKNRYFQELLKNAEGLSEETRQKLIEMMIKNAENLDDENKENLLRELMDNVVKYLPPEMAAKVLGEIMKSTDKLDTATKQKMIETLLKKMDDLPPELRQKAMEEIIKNLDNLDKAKKEEILKDILSKVDNLPPELRDQTLQAIVDNMQNLNSDQKLKLLQKVLEKVEKNGGDSKLSKQLRNSVLKELVKTSKNLDEKSRAKILKQVFDKIKDEEDVPDVIMSELIKQMDSLPNDYKDKIIKEIKKSVKKGKIAPEVLAELIKNSKNLPPEILEELIENMGKMDANTMKELVKNINNLPSKLKKKALKDMVKNIKNLDPTVQNELLKQMLKNPNLFENPEEYEKALNDLIDNLDQMPEKVRKEMMKDLAKNIKNLSKDMKKKVIKEVLNKLVDVNDEDRQDVLKQLLRNMGQKELEEWIKNSDMSEEMKKKMLADIKTLIDSGNAFYDSDDEEELEGLSKEEKAKRKKELIEKRKRMMKDMDYPDDLLLKDIMKDYSSVKSSEKAKKPKGKEFLEKFADSVLKPRARTPGGSELPLSQDEIDFVREFNKLSDAEKRKYLSTLTQAQRDALMKLTQDYVKQRQEEFTKAVEESKLIAIEKMREKMAADKKAAILKALRVEKNLREHNNKLTRAFVFSYYDLAVQR